MTDIGIQTDELYINGMTLQEFLLLEIPQTRYLKTLDKVSSINSKDEEAGEEIGAGDEGSEGGGYVSTDTDTDTDTDAGEDNFTSEEKVMVYESIGDYIDSIVMSNMIEKNIEYIRSVPQHQQRTPEWYKRRNEMITASAAWKVFKSDSNINQLVYEKCSAAIAAASVSLSTSTATTTESSDDNDSNNETISSCVPALAPIPQAKTAYVNVNSPLHWGQKYEEISRLIYESRNNTQVGEFGCIPHSDYPFLGASPDGININPSSPLYGRMLEIKNIFNRVIDGVPLEEYWIQMQLQMQVCKCTECDFLETRFKEYPDEEEFLKDSASELDNEFHLTAARTLKGVFSYFIKDGGTPVYYYAPLYLTRKEYDTWREEIIDKHTDLVWIKNIYWYLDQYSCVLVLRNDLWFQNAIPQIEKVWNIIVKERETGYEHRAPKKRLSPSSTTTAANNKKLKNANANANANANSDAPNNGCLIMISDLELNI